MGTINLRNLFIRLQDQMACRLSTDREVILHPGTKGDASELNWIKWLRKYLPKRYTVDKAFIIDCENNISDQIDLVIYDQQYSPFVFNQDSAKYIPAESVYAVFEVKQTLNKSFIEYAGKKAKSVRVLKRTSAPIYHAGGKYGPKPHQNIISGILTLESEWNPPLGDNFESSIYNLSKYKKINIGCALQSGAFLVDYKDHVIEKSSNEESLIFFFLKLLIELHKLGTIPALDIECYARSLESI
ncbi:MAG: DUF6602 domain-containing protein [Halanaerobiales bacterium]